MNMLLTKKNVLCFALFLFCCSAAPSFVKLPLFHEFEQFGSNYLSHCDKGVCQSVGGSDGHELGFVVPEDMCVKHHAKFGSILPREKSGRDSFCIFPLNRQILTGEKLWVVIQLLHSLTLLTSCMIQSVHTSNFGANNLRN